MQHLESSCVESGATFQALASHLWCSGTLLEAPSGSHDEPGSHEQHEYRAELATSELIAEVRRLLDTERRVERLICRYLADLADRIRQRQDNVLWAYADEFHAARCFFGLGVRDTRERVRVGRALRRLPQLEAAFVAGELSYSRVREVTRVAEPQTESGWVELARTVDMRALERKVAAAREPGLGSSDDDGGRGGGTAGWDEGGPDVDRQGGEGGALDGRDRGRMDRPARTEWLSSNALRVSFELSAEAWGLLERALEGARRSGVGAMSDGEALVAVARDALSSQTQNPDASDPRSTVVVYECQACAKSAVDTGVGLLELDQATADALGCSAAEVDLASEGRSVRRGGPLPAAVRRAVMLRDHCRCRVPGCNRRRYVDVHHLTAQARGGEHSRSNCMVLCTTHHRLLHDGKLDVTGDAEGDLCFRDAQGCPLVELNGCTGAHGGRPATSLTPELQARSDVDWGTTQGGTSHEFAARLLHAIGRRGGWTIDEMVEKSGLSASAVSAALTLLELGGLVCRRDFTFDPA